MRGSIIVILLLSASAVRCQEPAHKQFTVKDGLPGSVVYHTIQDRKGFIWFATNQGVSRFDGRQFRNFTKEDGLPDNDIVKLYLDKYDNIWCISFLGTPSVFYNNTILRFDSCTAVRAICEDLLSDSIELVSSDFRLRRVGYYLSPNIAGKWKFDAVMKSVYRFYDFPILRCSSPKGINFIFSCGMDTTQTLFVTDGVTRREYQTNATVQMNMLPFSFQQYYALSPDQKGIVFVSGDSLFYGDMQGITHLFHLHKFGICNVERDDIASMFYENDSTFWIASRSRGLLRIHHFGKPDQQTRIYFSGVFCTSFMKDGENGYWLTTNNDGVFYLPNLTFNTMTAAPELADRNILRIRRIGEHRIVAGLANGSIITIDSSGTHTFPQWAAVNRNNRPLGIQLYKRNELLIATDHGLFELNMQDDSHSMKVFRSYKDCYIAPNGMIAVAASDGAFFFSPGDFSAPRQTVGGRATCVTGTGGEIWWGTLFGVYHWQHDKVRNLGLQYPELSGIINHIDIAPDSACWISTEKGLFILKQGKLSSITRAQGLSSNLCKHVSFDEGTAWVSTNKGISRIDYSRDRNGRLLHSVSTITEEDGLTTNDVNQTAISDGFVYAATARGICYFPKSYISHSVSQPAINITRISTGDSNLTGDSVLIDANKVRLLIELSGISFRSGSQVQYEYRLAGVDSTWSRITGNSIELSRLPYGRFAFEARAIDRWGRISARPARIFITHPPHVWQTSWFFFSSYLLLALLTGAGFYTFHHYQHRKKENQYRLRKKMQDLELMALRAQMNPHFIFNCLTSIQYHILRADIRNASAYLHKFSTLIRQTLQNSATSMIPLREEIKLLQLYLELEHARFGEKMEYRVEISSELQTDKLLIPCMIIQPYVENAIKHGIGQREEERPGIVLLSFRNSENCILCEIEDNGPGIKNVDLKRHKPEGDYQSMGTRITENRVNTLNMLQKEKIRIEVIDKLQSGREESGTMIRLFFPVITD